MSGLFHCSLLVNLVLVVSVSLDEEIYKTQAADKWFQDGEELLQTYLNMKMVNKKAKGAVIFIGDGMGVSTVTAARILDGQLKGMKGEENVLSWEDNKQFANVALSKTYNTDVQTADSAASATAILTGVKTNEGVVSQTDKVSSGDSQFCGSQRVLSIIMLAELAGLSTGVVTTARLTHATPAAAYAQTPKRGWESDADIPAGVTCKDIASQLIDFPYGDGLEVAFGGGREMFLPNTQRDVEEKDQFGTRKDGRNLVQEWLNKSEHHNYVYNETGFKNLRPQEVGHVLGLFNYDHMQFAYNRINDTAGEPSFTDMVEFAIKVLQKNPKGYVLLAEAGRIDHAHHNAKAFHALHDTVEMGKAVQKAVDLTNPDETLMIVTADHSHVFTFGGYQSRGTPIFDYTNMHPQKSTDGMKFTSLAYYNGPGAGRRVPSKSDMNNPEYRWPSLVPLTSETHGAEDVAVHARGVRSHLIRGVVEQNYIFHVLDFALCLSKNKKMLCNIEERKELQSNKGRNSDQIRKASLVSVVLTILTIIWTCEVV